MLTENSYHIALYTYVGAAAVMLAYLTWWLSRHWRPGFVALVVLLLAALMLTPAYPKAGVATMAPALMLTPAYPKAGVATMAPALIVAVFQIFTQGLDAAQHALRPLIFVSGMAILLALLLSLTVFRVRKPRKSTHGKARAKA